MNTNKPPQLNPEPVSAKFKQKIIKERKHYGNKIFNHLSLLVLIRKRVLNEVYARLFHYVLGNTFITFLSLIGAGTFSK